MSVHYTDSDSFLESAMVAGASKELLIRILNNWETPKGESYEFDSSTMVSGFCHLSTVCVFFWGRGVVCVLVSLDEGSSLFWLHVHWFPLKRFHSSSFFLLFFHVQ